LAWQQTVNANWVCRAKSFQRMGTTSVNLTKKISIRLDKHGNIEDVQEHDLNNGSDMQSKMDARLRRLGLKQ
jgi:hypothetical protein